MVNELFLQIKHKATALAKVQPVHAWQHPKNTASISCDGVAVGSGTIDGRLVFVFAQDATVIGGSL